MPMFKHRGQIFLLSILILSAVLIIGLVLMTVFIKDLKQSTETSVSMQAFYAADSAIEWQIYSIFHPNFPRPDMTNNTSFEWQNDYDTSGKIQAIGIAGNTRRGIEINFITEP